MDSNRAWTMTIAGLDIGDAAQAVQMSIGVAPSGPSLSASASTRRSQSPSSSRLYPSERRDRHCAVQTMKGGLSTQVEIATSSASSTFA